MRFAMRFCLLLCVILAAAGNLRAEDSESTGKRIRAAIIKSIPLLEKGAAGSADQRKCFTCHNQAAPVFALVEARGRGFTIDQENLKRQLQHAADHLKRGKKNYLAGKGQGGSVFTAGYALLALEAGGHKPDERTAAVTHYLLEHQKDMKHWRMHSNRPPTSGSDFTATYLALRGLAAFGVKDQSEKILNRKETVRQWLLKQSPSDTEDHVYRLRAASYIDIDEGSDGDKEQEALRKKARAELLDLQRKDGGWAQKSDMKSDAYATATALVALLREGGLPSDHAAIRRGTRYLLDTQEKDGSWHVVTRAKGFQKHFESGFPHGKDQFISIAASSWATLALVLTLPESTDED